MSLFNDGLMRKPKNTTLPNTLLTKKLILIQTRYMFLMEEHFCAKYDDLRASLLEAFASFMLITSHQNIASAQLYLTDATIQHLPKIMNTLEEVSIRAAMYMFKAMFQQRSTLNKMFFYQTALANLVSLTCY